MIQAVLVLDAKAIKIYCLKNIVENCLLKQISSFIVLNTEHFI